MRRLYLVEDQELLNSALKMLLDLEDDFEVVGTSLTGEDVAKQIMDLKVDVALLDIEMPKQSGLEIAKELRQQNYPGKIIILTTFARANYFKEALAQKVDGYLLKDSPSDSLVKAIRAILEGNTVFDPKLVSGVLNEVDKPLTKRELEILKMLEQVATTKELAQRLFLSEGTVRNYISSILSKTGTASRLEALNLARDKGWI